MYKPAKYDCFPETCSVSSNKSELPHLDLLKLNAEDKQKVWDFFKKTKSDYLNWFDNDALKSLLEDGMVEAIQIPLDEFDTEFLASINKSTIEK